MRFRKVKHFGQSQCQEVAALTLVLRDQGEEQGSVEAVPCWLTKQKGQCFHAVCVANGLHPNSVPVWNRKHLWKGLLAEARLRTSRSDSHRLSLVT